MAEKRPSLNVLSGPLSGRKLVLEDSVDNILIGSDPACGFVLDTPGVSPIHARLWVDLNGATVYDTNSPNGVYVNDDRVVKEAAVRNGDILWLGPPREEGSVLIQCILPPPPPPPAAEGSPGPAAATPPPLPSREATAPIDSGATMAFGMPAYLGDEPEMVETAPAADTEASDVDSTVVMTTSDIMDPAGPEVVEHAPADASALLDVSEGLEVDEPTAVLPPPIPAPPAPAPAAAPPEPALEEQGFPDCDVEPTVAMAPPPLPPPATAPPPPGERAGAGAAGGSGPARPWGASGRRSGRRPRSRGGAAWRIEQGPAHRRRRRRRPRSRTGGLLVHAPGRDPDRAGEPRGSAARLPGHATCRRREASPHPGAGAAGDAGGPAPAPAHPPPQPRHLAPSPL